MTKTPHHVLYPASCPRPFIMSYSVFINLIDQLIMAWYRHNSGIRTVVDSFMIQLGFHLESLASWSPQGVCQIIRAL